MFHIMQKKYLRRGQIKMKRETVGAAIFLLLVLNRQKSGPDFGSLAGDFHRMVGFMERVDSFGQMAVNPPPLPHRDYRLPVLSCAGAGRHPG